jgi:catalase
VHFVGEAVKHAKAVAAIGDGTTLLERVVVGAVRVAGEGDGVVVDHGVVSAASGGEQLPAGFIDAFTGAMAEHRAWTRPRAGIPA